MTDIIFLDGYLKIMLNRLKPDFSIDKVFLVRSEAELAGDVKQIPSGTFYLAAVIPSSDTRAMNIDNVKEHETWLFYALEKSDRKGITAENRLASVAQQQRVISKIKQIIRDDIYARVFPCHIRPDINSMHTDPEDNFHGSEGYSLSFKVESDDFFTTQI
jgi:hypothetical protein